MLDRGQLARASWTLADQGVVSLGTFLANIVLARQLVPAEYGTYALMYGILLTLQIVTASLLFYPLSVRRCVAVGTMRQRLMGTSFALTLVLCVPLCIVPTAVLAGLGRLDLLIPVLLYFCVWQTQEVSRRGLLADFRHRSALPGDALSYLGQVIAIFVLAQTGHLTLANVFYAMAGTSGVAALLQSQQAGMAFSGFREMRRTALDFWSIGGWSLANNLVATLRIQVFPWALAFLYGPATVAAFQAALNVVNVSNPVVIGLCNVIPQTAAQASSRGKRQAWLAARPFALMGVPPTFVFCAFALIAPGFILQLIYGSASPYLDHVTPVRILIVAWLLSYAAEMLCSYLHGVDAPRVAFAINASGAIAAALLVFPFIMTLGLTGACIALAIASVVRLVTSQALLLRIFADEHPRLA